MYENNEAPSLAGTTIQDTTSLGLSRPRAAHVVAVEQSAQVGALMTALAQAQAEMDNPEMDAVNYFKKQYASKASVRNATIPVLARNGIATTQCPEYVKAQGLVRCITILWHGEQYLKSTLECPVVRTRREERAWNQDAQRAQPIPLEELGHQDYTAVYTYISRIALKSICGVSDEADEEGEAVKDTPATTATRESWQERKARRTQESPAPRETAEETLTGNPREETADDRRTNLLWMVNDALKTIVTPLHTKENGLYKAVIARAFGVTDPRAIKQVSLEILEAGMPTFEVLCRALAAEDATTIKADWVGTTLAALAHVGPPVGVNPVTGEDLRDMPEGWLTEAEQRAQHAPTVPEVSA
jgi:predicted XRE-type DNA-binding protein